MTKVQVTGTLYDPSGAIQSINTPIEIITVKGGGTGILKGAQVHYKTNSEGIYDFNLGLGIHLISVRYSEEYTTQGKVTINNETSSPITIDLLLESTEPLTPPEIAEVASYASQAQSAANEAEQYAKDAQSAANSAADDAVSAVEEELNDEVNTAQSAAIVANQQADLAKQWAVGTHPEDESPSDTNNSQYFAKMAQQFATRALAWGGVFTPTSNNEYPDNMQQQDTQYVIKLQENDESYTFISGELAGTTVMNGYTLIYDVTTEGVQWVSLPYNFGGFLEINGIEPDSLGRGMLKASNFSDIYSSDEVDEMFVNFSKKITPYIFLESNFNLTEDDISATVSSSPMDVTGLEIFFSKAVVTGNYVLYSIDIEIIFADVIPMSDDAINIIIDMSKQTGGAWDMINKGAIAQMKSTSNIQWRRPSTDEPEYPISTYLLADNRLKFNSSDRSNIAFIAESFADSIDRVRISGQIMSSFKPSFMS